MSRDYRAIYESLETTLRSQSRNPGEFDRKLSEVLSQFDGRSVSSDDDFHWVMVYVAFYSGMKAKTVSDRIPVIREYLHGYQRVAEYDDEKVREMMIDKRMLRNEKKIRASVQNARSVKEVVGKYGSFGAYLDSFNWRSSPENLIRLRNELMARFAMLKSITSFHFMMDVGLPVLKPDRVVMRVLHRLGLTPTRSLSEENLRKAVEQGLQLSRASGKSIRQIDMMLVSLGQVGGSSDLGIDKGTCLEKSPDCDVCGLSNHCQYFKDPEAFSALSAVRERTKGKTLEEPCAICGDERWTDKAHFPKRKRDGAGDDDIIYLCPTHHKLLDSGRISRIEFMELMKLKEFKGKASSVEDFVEWAHEKGYPYTLANLTEKFWDYQE